jgi:hypothetical protein
MEASEKEPGSRAARMTGLFIIIYISSALCISGVNAQIRKGPPNTTTPEEPALMELTEAERAMADLKTYSEFTREFVQTVHASKKAGRTIDDVVNSWKTPERFQKEGYLTPDQIQQITRQPLASQTARLRANVEVIWNETR